jgi:pimeloyl-ACP methyl ester carboxylesterase
MARIGRKYIDDLRGANRVALDAVRGVTDLVEAMHHTIGGGPAILGKPLTGPVRLITWPAYAAIRSISQWLGLGIDKALSRLTAVMGEAGNDPERGAIVAALNGVLGDYLAETGNPLAIPMRLRRGGQSLTLTPSALAAAIPEATGKVLVLIHGSSMGETSWNRNGRDFGPLLERNCGSTAVYLSYNTGLHISVNGRAFADELEKLIAAWPVPVEELFLAGHSMGGLVARSACHLAECQKLRWRHLLHKLICLGSPHLGAPLERGGNWLHLLLGASRYSAPFGRLARIRSAGLTDLRFGYVLDEQWMGHDRFAFGGSLVPALALPEGVDCYAVAGTKTLDASDGRELSGDGLVPVSSALGQHEDPDLALAFPETNRWIGFGMNHLDLLDHPQIYERIISWLAAAD